MNPVDLLHLAVPQAARGGIDVGPINWLVLAPQIVLAVTATVMMALDLKFWSKYKHWVGFTGAVGFSLAILATLSAPFGETFHGMVILDGLSKWGLLLFCTLGLLTFSMSLDYLNKQKMAHGEFYILMMFAVIGMVVMVSTRELLTFFIGLETLSVPLYVLSGFSIYSRRSNEAGVKYLLLGAFGAAFLVYGIALVYAATGSLTFDGINASLLAMEEDSGARKLFQVGFALILVGLGFKISLVPFHMWTPDVYEGAPAPVTAFMSVGTKAAAVLGLMRFLHEGLGETLTPGLVGVLVILAVATMIVGNTGAVAQRNLKRMLAYSSIAHAGYLMVGLIAFNEASTQAVIYYLVAYLFLNMGAFGVLIAVAGRDDGRLTVEDFQGMGFRRPALAAFFTLCLLGLAGIPPTVGFFGKFYLFGNAIGEGFHKVAAIGFMTSVVGVYYYLKPVVAMYMKPAQEGAPEQPYTMSPVFTLGLIATGIGIVGAGLFPKVLLNPLWKIFTDAAS